MKLGPLFLSLDAVVGLICLERNLSLRACCEIEVKV